MRSIFAGISPRKHRIRIGFAQEDIRRWTLDGIIVDGKVYTKDSDSSDLEQLLISHLGLDRINERAVGLTDAQLLLVKSWLLAQIENDMSAGEFSCVEHGIPGLNGGPMEVVFARGRTLNGQSFLWHEPLPWPEDWSKERISFVSPVLFEIYNSDSTVSVRYSRMTAEFDALQTKALIEVLKSVESSEVGEPIAASFVNGALEVRNYEDHVCFDFERTDFLNQVSTSLHKQQIGPIISGLELALQKIV